MTAGISRVTLPQEFYDITSAQLLKQPEPEYLYAQLVKSAIMTDLGLDIASVNGRNIPDSGAPYSSAQEDRLDLESNQIAMETFGARVDFSKAASDVVRINRPVYTDSTYTLASRTISSGHTISTNAIVPDSEQVMIKLERIGGPYNNSIADIAPYGIEAFYSQMGVHRASDIVGKHLQRDFDKTIDSVARSMLDDGSTAVYPSGMTAVTDATAKGQFPLTYAQITRAARTMDDAKLPKYGTGRRILVVTPTGKRQLKDDPQFARYAEFHRDKNPLFPGWFATCDDFDVFVSNTLTQSDNASSIEIHYAHAFAPGVLGIGMGRPPEVRPSSDDNYGETLRLIWLADLGFKLLDSRFVVSVRYTEDEA